MALPDLENNLLYTLKKEAGSTLPIDIWYEGEIWVFHPVGSIDITTSVDLEETLMEGIAQGMRYIVLDLTDVRMVSSAGIRVIIAAFKALKKVNGEICFSTPNMSVSEVLRLTGLLKIINVYPDNIVAIRSFSV
ncbi:MAG TPA: STAS domain-containing protein [Methanospirillum sp.]|uniref:STAS domain-containing protein n=1 Tax=Methanospirillum sp. TaxID=45200 RepID=UPI002D0C0947|nr:STAS domain-containing protein [Methanospirillum sp.]HOJ95427.1 STAS domain-containing protein [Methanospirillum sp.]HOL40302.1 STAS domain-containing protein [Methanospirillum sp.]HPP78234.1 STAS domain-containing protein [Methanospirillum sp.]